MDRVPVYDKSVKRLYICIASRMLSKFLHSMIFKMAETMCQRIIWTGGRRPHACTRIAFVVVTVTQRVPYIMAKYRYCYGDFICDYRRIAFSFGRDLVHIGLTYRNTHLRVLKFLRESPTSQIKFVWLHSFEEIEKSTAVWICLDNCPW